MKHKYHKQLHRLLIWIFIFALLFGIGLSMLVSVQTSAKQAQNNPFPISQDRFN